MKRFSKILLLLLVVGYITTLVSCEDDEGPAALEIESIMATGTDLESGETVDKDLNAATAAEDVPVDAVVEIVFSRNVDPSTVSQSTIMISDADGNVTISVSTSGATVTITLDETLERGTDYTLTVTSGVSAEDGGAFKEVSRTFNTGGRSEVTPPQASNQQIYLNLNGNSEDQLSNYDVANEAAIEYGEDRFGQTGSAAYFDGDASIIEYADGVNLISQDFTLSTWIYVDTIDHTNQDGGLAGMFAFGIGNFRGIQLEMHQWAKYNRMKFAQTFTSDHPDNPTTAEDFTIWDLDGNLEDFEVNRGADFENTVTDGLAGLLVGKWAHLVYVYSSAENKRYCYINGTLQRSTDFDNSTFEKIQMITGMTFAPTEQEDEPSDDAYVSKRLALGFIHGSDSKKFVGTPWGDYSVPTAQHFKGAFDDFRIFNAALTDSEVQALYDDEKP